MGRRITNLWEALTHIAACARRHPTQQEQDDSVLVALSQATRWSGQELSLEANDEGWVIRVFSCYSGSGCPNCDPDLEIVLTIPKDRRTPPRVEERPR